MRDDEAGSARVVDAAPVGLLEKIFPPSLVDEAIDAADAREVRVRSLPSRLTVYFTLGMWLYFGKGYVRVMRELVAGLRAALDGLGDWSVPTDASISKARARVGPDVLHNLFTRVAGPVGTPETPGAFWRGRRVLSTDGTVVDLANTDENAEKFAYPSGGANPQARIVALAECGTMSLTGAAVDSIEVGERALFRQLLPLLGKDDILLADRGFPSYKLWKEAEATGAALLWRVNSSFKLPIIKRLPDGTFLSQLHGRRKHERATVRVIEFSVTDDDGGTSELFCLITNLLDPGEAPALELARLYADRWKIEIIYHALKVDLRTPGTTLRSKTPGGAKQELWAMLCTYQAVRTLVSQASAHTGLDPGRISFPQALDAVRQSVGTVFSP
jgi:hypothetical protein